MILPALSTQFVKSPLYISGVGTDCEKPVAPARLRKNSLEKKKNVLSRPL